MENAVILLGGNLGDIALSFRDALRSVAGKGCELTSCSSVYRTEPWGMPDQPSFLNMVACLRTGLSPRELMDLLLETERAAGRERVLPNGPRPLDLDILFYGSEIIKEDGLEIPHPRLHLRNFTLVPLAEVIPEFIHPVLNLSVSELLVRAGDNLDVIKTGITPGSCS